MKVEDDEIINNVGYFYIDDKYKNLIDKTFRFALMDEDFHFTNFDNRKIGSSKVVNKYLGEINFVLDNALFNFKKLIKILANIDNKINMVIGNYKPKINIEYGH